MARDQVEKNRGPQSPKKESLDLLSDRTLHTLLNKEHVAKRNADIFLLILILLLIVFMML